MARKVRPLAVVTGASTGIGYELAKCCAREGFDLVVVADEPKINDAAKSFEALGATVTAVEADLATFEGVDRLCAAFAGRPVDALLANAGRGLGRGFLDQNFDDVMRVVNTNITGTIYLIQKVGRDMRDRRSGRILITGSTLEPECLPEPVDRSGYVTVAQCGTSLRGAANSPPRASRRPKPRPRRRRRHEQRPDRAGILGALQRFSRGRSGQPAHRPKTAYPIPPSREQRKALTTWQDSVALRHLKEISVETGLSQQALIAEAINQPRVLASAAFP
jgi:hypothetical protein